jgi:signal transduction histidine kinase
VVCPGARHPPLAELQQRIRRRESTDLSPLAVADVPDEVAPLVTAINDLLERLDRTIATQRHFLADAAHQLKTPLAGLRMQAELAAREIDSGGGDPVSMKHSLRQIALSTQRAAHMVNQLLAMARAEDTGQVLRKTSVDLAAVTRAVVRDFVPRAIERQIDLGYEGPDGHDGARLIGEPVLLGELVRNLVDNALQYTPGGGTVTARVQHDARGAADRPAGGRHRPGHRPGRTRSGVPALLPRAGHAGGRQRAGPGHRAGNRPAPRCRHPAWPTRARAAAKRRPCPAPCSRCASPCRWPAAATEPQSA